MKSVFHIRSDECMCVSLLYFMFYPSFLEDFPSRVDDLTKATTSVEYMFDLKYSRTKKRFRCQNSNRRCQNKGRFEANHSVLFLLELDCHTSVRKGKTSLSQKLIS